MFTYDRSNRLVVRVTEGDVVLAGHYRVPGFRLKDGISPMQIFPLTSRKAIPGRRRFGSTLACDNFSGVDFTGNGIY